MPKIETKESALFGFLGEHYTDDMLEEIFPVAKAELDEHVGDVIKIELNDTNRPDLWSCAGVARAINNYKSGTLKEYDFFSTAEESCDSEGRLFINDPSVTEVRPFSIGFAVEGHKVTEDDLEALIQTQEKLCWNYGRKRRSIAMGIYRSDLIKFPVHYIGADPDETKFVPLGMDEELSLREICEKHPKGKEYGYIVKDHEAFPFLHDDDDNPLSFPPVINSSTLGAVEVGDERLFIEFSGTNLNNLLLSASIVACDMVDMGFVIKPVKVLLAQDTEYGREITVPYYYQKPVKCPVALVHKTLGEKLTPEQITDSLKRMGIFSTCDGEYVYATVPEYRDDFLHPADLVEDIMIGYGLNNFTPEMPGDFTMGRLTKAEEFGRKIKDIMIGLGFQEMIYNYLGSGREYIQNMCIDGKKCIQIANPMSENYEYVRPSIIPALMESESVSGHAPYPHNIFEVGKVAFLEPSDNSGTVTRNNLGFLVSDTMVGYNEVSSYVNTLMYFIRKDYRLEVLSDDPRFIEGRCAQIVVNDVNVGVFGEIHPQVLENWGCSMPTVACELDLDLLLEN